MTDSRWLSLDEALTQAAAQLGGAYAARRILALGAPDGGLLPITMARRSAAVTLLTSNAEHYAAAQQRLPQALNMTISLVSDADIAQYADMERYQAAVVISPADAPIVAARLSEAAVGKPVICFYCTYDGKRFVYRQYKFQG